MNGHFARTAAKKTDTLIDKFIKATADGYIGSLFSSSEGRKLFSSVGGFLILPSRGENYTREGGELNDRKTTI